jgi:glycosyltransferase involved in cell wall biosynthesis
MLTVLLATKNRAAILRQVLESYCRLIPPDGGWNLIIADNGSTDGTPQMIREFVGRLPLQYVIEPTTGKNAALNRGLEYLRGDLVVLTDDDAFPAQDWLVQLRKTADCQKDYSIFGGKVVPRWETPPPRWVAWLNQSAVFTISDQELIEGPLELHSVFGPNMVVRKGVFDSGVRFDVTIGPSGTNYAMGSETELVLRLGRQGHKAWYIPSAVVEHFIRAEQLRKSWVFGRALRYGRGQYRLYGPVQAEDTRLLLGVPRYLYRKILKQTVLVLSNAILFRRESLFRARWRFNFFRGQIAEARSMSGI